MDKPDIPTFSLAERDRRWKAVRAEMKKANLDAVIGLPNQGHWDQFGADTRYLTQIGGFQTEGAVVFPLEEEVAAGGRGGNAGGGGGGRMRLPVWGAGGGGDVPWATWKITGGTPGTGFLNNTRVGAKSAAYLA